jgi:segregation and condensation protein B
MNWEWTDRQQPGIIGYNSSILKWAALFMTENQPAQPDYTLEAKLEALLFAASTAVSPLQLAGALGIATQEAESGLKRLGQSFDEGRGIGLQWHNGRVQITTQANLAPVVERFLGLEATARLSRAALETLTIIAYRQPITRPGIDAIRGVSSDGVLKNLLSKGLVQEVGRAEGPGRPVLFGITSDFLQHFGLSSLEQLPPYELLTGEEEQTKNGLLKD